MALRTRGTFCCCMQGRPGGKSFWFTWLIFTTTIRIVIPGMSELAWRRVHGSNNEGYLIVSFILALIRLPALWQNAQRLAAGAQVAQTLTTPVVSIATPSLLAQGLPFSAMPTAYNTGEDLCHTDTRLKRFWVNLRSFVHSQSISWPAQILRLYTLWRRLEGCCPPACPRGNSRLFPSNPSSSNSN